MIQFFIFGVIQIVKILVQSSSKLQNFLSSQSRDQSSFVFSLFNFVTRPIWPDSVSSNSFFFFWRLAYSQQYIDKKKGLCTISSNSLSLAELKAQPNLDSNILSQIFTATYKLYLQYDSFFTNKILKDQDSTPVRNRAWVQTAGTRAQTTQYQPISPTNTKRISSCQEKGLQYTGTVRFWLSIDRYSLQVKFYFKNQEFNQLNNLTTA